MTTMQVTELPEQETAPEEQPQSVADIVSDMLENRRRRRDLEAEIKGLNEKWRGLEQKLLQILESQGMQQVSVAGLGTASVSETVIPIVEDWDSFYQYIHDEEAYYLLQRRPATAAYRELVDASGEDAVPGVRPGIKRSISLRSK